MRVKPMSPKYRNLTARGPLLALVDEVRRLRGIVLGREVASGN